MNNVLAIIPARGGSKGIPRKNLYEIAGKPLIEYTIKSALKSNLISDLILSTDSIEIAEVASSLGCQVPFLRPTELASDSALTVDVLIHALNYMEKKNKDTYDSVLLLQPTTPLRPDDLIDSSIRLLADNPLADSVVSLVDVGANHPYRMYTLDSGYLRQLFPDVKNSMMPRQELPPVYIRSGDIYLTRRDVLLNTHSLIGKKSLGIQIHIDTSVNIDTYDDIDKAVKLLNSNNA